MVIKAQKNLVTKFRLARTLYDHIGMVFEELETT